MALTKFLVNVENHQSLGNNPNSDDGLSAQDLKILFDKGAVDIKSYINNTLTTELDSLLASKADDNSVVKLTGNQSVGGIKTFTSLPRIPLMPVMNEDATSKKYVDDEIAGVVLGQIPDGSLTDAKLSNAPGQIKAKVSTLETEVQAIEDDLNTPSYSSPLSIIKQVASLPTNVVDGKLLARIKGISLVNTINDSSFQTTGYGDAITSKFNVTSFKNGEKWCFYCKYEVVEGTNGGASGQIRILAPSTTVLVNAISGEGISIRTFTSDIDATNISAYGPLTDEGSGRIANWSDVIAINMTALGIEDFIQEDMLKISRSINAETTDIQNAKVDLKTVGKNLFNGELVIGAINGSTGAYNPGATTQTTSEFYTKVEGGEDYVISKSNAVAERLDVFYYDSNFNYLGSDANGQNGFTTPSNCMYVRWNTSGGFTDLTILIQLERGSTATAHNPYKDSNLLFDTELPRVPNDVRDELFNAQLVSGVLKSTDMWTYVQNVKEYILQAEDFESLFTSGVNVDKVVISVLPNQDETTGGASKIGKGLLSEFSEVPEVGNDALSNVGCYYVGAGTGGKFVLLVAKGTYANLTEAQNDLAGTKILYQLAVPQGSEVDLKDILSFEDGTLYNNGNPIPEIEYSAPKNLNAIVHGNTEMIENVSDRLDNVEDKILDVITGEVTVVSGNTLIDMSNLDNGVYELSFTLGDFFSIKPKDVQSMREVFMNGSASTITDIDINGDLLGPVTKTNRLEINISSDVFIIKQEVYNLITSDGSGNGWNIGLSSNISGDGKLLVFNSNGGTAKYKLIKKSL